MSRKNATRSVDSIRRRAVIIALLLIPLNSYWVLHLSYVYDSNRPASLALLFNVLFILLMLTLVNNCVRRARPIWALTQGELLAVYAMLCQATVFAGRDMIQVLVPLLANPFTHATPENEWAQLFHRHLPDWLTVDDPAALDGFQRGMESLYRAEAWRPWLGPLSVWIVFIGVLAFTMLCVSVLVRRQWSDREKLTYPIVALPLDVTSEIRPHVLFHSRTMWTGAAVAATLNLLNAVGQVFPQAPSFPLYTEVHIAAEPWSAMDPPGLRFSVFPFAIGVGYFIPLDLAFSGWFFYLFWLAQRVIGATVGWHTLGFPFHVAQLQGTWIALFLFVMWSGRHHFLGTLKSALSPRARPGNDGEGMTYRFAVWGLVFGLAAMTLFSWQAGMQWWFALAFFGLYLAMAAVVSRVRAELGPPAHGFYNAGPDTILTSFLGTKTIGRQSLSAMSLFYWINHLSYRSHPMPHQLEGLWLANKVGANARKVAVLILVGAVAGSIAAAWGHLHISYQMGLENGRSWYARSAYTRLAQWVRAPGEPDAISMAFSGVGFVFSSALLLLRKRFLWFPFHPVGYVVSSWWTFTGLWFPLFIAWATKAVVLRIGGVRAYRRLRPFFSGLIVGDVLMASVVSLVSCATGIPVRYLSW
jgi:hypothetical protein